jgi:hypothetical protein
MAKASFCASPQSHRQVRMIDGSDGSDDGVSSSTDEGVSRQGYEQQAIDSLILADCLTTNFKLSISLSLAFLRPPFRFEARRVGHNSLIYASEACHGK